MLHWHIKRLILLSLLVTATPTLSKVTGAHAEALINDFTSNGVYGTIYAINEPVSLILKDILGGLFEIKHILPPGVDPHSFQLTPDLITQLKESELIVLIDPDYFGLEKSIVELDTLKDVPKLYKVNYSKYGWSYMQLSDFGENYHGSWLSPTNALAIAEATVDFVKDLYPELEGSLNIRLSAFQRDLKQFLSTLAELSKEYRASDYTGIAAIPPITYLINISGLKVGDVILYEPDEELSFTRYNEIKEELRGDGKFIIVAPKEFEYSKVGEVAKQLAMETGKTVVFVPVFSSMGAGNYSEFLRVACYSILGSLGSYYASTSAGGMSSNNILLYIALFFTLVLAVIEAYAIYRYKREEWESFRG